MKTYFSTNNNFSAERFTFSVFSFCAEQKGQRCNDNNVRGVKDYTRLQRVLHCNAEFTGESILFIRETLICIVQLSWKDTLFYLRLLLCNVNAIYHNESTPIEITTLTINEVTRVIVIHRWMVVVTMNMYTILTFNDNLCLVLRETRQFMLQSIALYIHDITQ